MFRYYFSGAQTLIPAASLELSNKAEATTITPVLTPSCMNVDTYAYDFFFLAYFHECNSVTVLRMADCWSNFNPDT